LGRSAHLVGASTAVTALCRTSFLSSATFVSSALFSRRTQRLLTTTFLLTARYSYGAASFAPAQRVRPDMGWEHVLAQFIVRVHRH
jgi:hypothetical protein